MLLIGIVLGLFAGLLAGGKLDNLLFIQLRWLRLIALAVLLRFGTQLAIQNGVELANLLRLPLLLGAFALLILALWLNRERAGLLAVAAGSAANAVAIGVNGGWMPVSREALAFVGLSTDDLNRSFHRLLPEVSDPGFLLQLGPLGDVIPFPSPVLTNVGSIGDVFISLGLGWFVFSALLHEPEPAPTAARLARAVAAPTRLLRPAPAAALAVAPSIGVAGAMGLAARGGLEARSESTAVALDRPLVFGGSTPGATVPLSRGGALPLVGGVLRVLPGVAARVWAHPYVRLAGDHRFSAFWISQTISLFGDRLHQVALGVLVLGATGSPLATGFAFLAASLPNLLLGPIAGTFVDRWDHKKVLIASDLVRAGLVLLVPLAAVTNILLVYPLLFLITTASLFFRPAKAAVLPRIVREDDLMAANSATWTGETLADIAGYPVAGLFVAFLGAALPIAFWVDAASYLISAVLLVGLAIPPVIREVGEVARDRARGVRGAVAEFRGELVEGWRFLRTRAPLFHNTLVSAVAQTSIGATIALTVVYAQLWLEPGAIPYPQNYAAIETAIGVGNLVGGFTIGALGNRLRKGPLVIGGYVAMGLATVFLGLTTNVLLAVGLGLVIGVANLVFIIPTQTLFAELTPNELMGRVVAFRGTLVFGSMTLAMAAAGIVAEFVPVGLVIAAFGAVTAVAGLAAALLPSIRDS